MKRGHSSNRRRHLAVWFPYLATDRLASARPEGGAPLVLVDKDKGALRLTAADPEALAVGLHPGMTLADARARTPQLEAVPHDPAGDEVLLRRALIAFGRFSPMIALCRPHGLMLDVTGCAHLFDGEAGLVRRVRELAAQMGLQARTALARTPQTARALARFGPGGVVPEGEDRRVARALPISALELKPEEAQALRRAGLITLGDLDDRPRAAFAARFGRDFPHRLDLILGQADARITPVRPAPPVMADRVLAEPIQTDEAVEAVLSDLLAEVMAGLETRRCGARLFVLSVFRVDGHVRRIGVGTARPTRDARAVLRLFKERLAALAHPLDPGFGFDQLRLQAGRLQTIPAEQEAFEARSARTEALDALIDRLTARLGPEAVLKVEPVDTHLPERACRLTPAVQAAAAQAAWPEREPEQPPLRPLQLFDPPQPVEAISLAPDGPPARFRWRRITHQVTRAEGPERIEDEWWRKGRRVRDYYRVEDAEGRRFWLFRAGHFGEEPEPRWYVHGLFP
ncbi:DNA polymerase Y family protein [Brevundimonas sp. 2R-24]|uniref:DNA-directed DNA polymerase n=1 Tax=Peiella sedimenti TaxID=3061083 RepID=A0ABT8SLD2_9CAUL|nr:DNA polymerase Y family protein [Caulobacteraceae bacterium XZ-24]